MMIENLGEMFTQTEVMKNDVLVDFVHRMKVDILGSGLRTREINPSVKNFMLPNFLLIYVLKGTIVLQHRETSITLSAGSIYLLEPFELYSFFRLSTEPAAYAYIYFGLHPFSARGIFTKCISLEGDSFFQQSWTNRLRPALDIFTQLDSTDKFFRRFMIEHAVNNLIVNVLYGHLDNSHNLKTLYKVRENNLIDYAFTYVEENLNVPLNIGSLVKVLNTSRRSLDRAFLIYYKKSPLKALIRFKMYRAVEFMEEGFSVKETALAVGYTSVFHFSRSFKNVMGKCPTEYMHGADQLLVKKNYNSRALKLKKEQALKTPDANKRKYHKELHVINLNNLTDTNYF